MTKQKKQTEQHTEHPLEEGAGVKDESNVAAEQTSEAGAAGFEGYEDFQKAFDEIKKQLSESTDGWQRERADFSNYKKRIDREREMQRSLITGELCKKFLVVMDDLERAMKNRPQDGDGAAWAEGIELVMRKLQGILEMENITRMPAEKETFDPNRHEAVSSEASDDHESGEIIEVLQQGYMIGDRVLRPALVRVAQ